VQTWQGRAAALAASPGPRRAHSFVRYSPGVFVKWGITGTLKDIRYGRGIPHDMVSKQPARAQPRRRAAERGLA
jgi:hypothetical protein